MSGPRPTTTPGGNASAAKGSQPVSPSDPAMNRHGIGGNFPPPGRLPITPNPTTGKQQTKPLFVGPLRPWLENILPRQVPIASPQPEPVGPAEEARPQNEAPVTAQMRTIEEPYGLDEHLAHIQGVIAPRGGDPLAGLIVPAGGIQARIGVQLHPSLPEPDGGRDYVPDNESHAKGYRGELNLANRIAMRIRDERVIRYGNKAGENGPDIISVSKDGDLTIWDSKWRSAERGMTESGRGHPSSDSIPLLKASLERALVSARATHLIDDERFKKAMAKLEQGNFFIVTVGTGNAYDAVIQEVRNSQPGEPKRVRWSDLEKTGEGQR